MSVHPAKLCVGTFLRQHLEDPQFSHLLEWIDKDKGQFRILWVHAGRANFDKDYHQALFQAYRQYKGLPVGEDAKQSFGMALKKSPAVQTLNPHPEDDWRYYVFSTQTPCGRRCGYVRHPSQSPLPCHPSPYSQQLNSQSPYCVCDGEGDCESEEKDVKPPLPEPVPTSTPHNILLPHPIPHTIPHDAPNTLTPPATPHLTHFMPHHFLPNTSQTTPKTQALTMPVSHTIPCTISSHIIQSVSVSQTLPMSVPHSVQMTQTVPLPMTQSVSHMSEIQVVQDVPILHIPSMNQSGSAPQTCSGCVHCGEGSEVGVSGDQVKQENQYQTPISPLSEDLAQLQIGPQGMLWPSGHASIHTRPPDSLPTAPHHMPGATEWQHIFQFPSTASQNFPETHEHAYETAHTHHQHHTAPSDHQQAAHSLPRPYMPHDFPQRHQPGRQSVESLSHGQTNPTLPDLPLTGLSAVVPWEL